jgi:hypothetical protein
MMVDGSSGVAPEAGKQLSDCGERRHFRQVAECVWTMRSGMETILRGKCVVGNA